MRLAGKIAVIVGAGQSPGEGIGNGRATVLRFAQEGARILAVDRDLASAEETAALAAKEGCECVAFEADVTREATLAAVHETLSDAASTLRMGDRLLVSFSGHGVRVRDTGTDRFEKDERDHADEGWCLSDGVLVDDKLAGYWRVFDPGVRIVLVTESCYGGGMGRDGECVVTPPDLTWMGGAVRTPSQVVYRGGGESDLPCIDRAPCDRDGIRASVLMLSACRENQVAQDGLFSGCLFTIWDGGAFEGSYCALFRKLQAAVGASGCGQEPRIQMLGAPDEEFQLQPAFRVDTRAGTPATTYR